IYRSCEVTDFTQDDGGVDIEFSAVAGGSTSCDGSLRAEYLVGCDGGRSLIRKKGGIDFPGLDAAMGYLIDGSSENGEPAGGIRRGERGVNALAKLDDGRRLRLVLIENEVKKADEPTFDELREALLAVYGKDFGIHDVTWLSRFSDATRQAARYR